jgi:hypothetical protein
LLATPGVIEVLFLGDLQEQGVGRVAGGG